eukprot:4359546-Pleurochrysis_carterae.AAC.1
MTSFGKNARRGRCARRQQGEHDQHPVCCARATGSGLTPGTISLRTAISVERRGDVCSTNKLRCAASGEAQEWCEGGLRSRTGVDKLHRPDGDGGAEGCDVEHHGKEGAKFEATQVIWPRDVLRRRRDGPNVLAVCCVKPVFRT